MKLTCEKLLLLAAILTASRAAATKSPVPLLEGLLLEAEENEIRVTGYDLKTGIVTTVPADVVEQGAVILSARLFCEIIRKMPGMYVTISVNSNHVANIICEASEFEILGTPASDYPELPLVDGDDTIEISEPLLKKMIAQTNFAVSDNEARPIHTGALFEIGGGMLTVVAVDGFRLALRREPMEGYDDQNFSFVVPGTALSEVEKIVSDNDKKVAVTLGAKHILFSFGSTILISRRLEGEFLNYRNSIPQSSKYQLRVDKESLVETLERVALIITDNLKTPVRCLFGDGIVKVSCITNIGKSSDECAIVGDGEDLEIGFNDRYLRESLKAAPAEEVMLELNNGITPCVISPVDGNSNFLYMILPVRLKAYEG